VPHPSTSGSSTSRSVLGNVRRDLSHETQNQPVRVIKARPHPLRSRERIPSRQPKKLSSSARASGCNATTPHPSPRLRRLTDTMIMQHDAALSRPVSMWSHHMFPGRIQTHQKKSLELPEASSPIFDMRDLLRFLGTSMG
jgi:hypothetical protein